MQTLTQPSTHAIRAWRHSYIRQRRTMHLVAGIVMLFLVLCLAACGRSSAAGENASPASQTADTAIAVSDAANASSNASTMIQPASGYGGLYVQVSGEKWPQNMLVLVALEDDQGRSETLAATDTDLQGNLTTGFLFPIDQRWLSAGSIWVVTTTADGRMETKAPFVVVAPGTEVATSSTSTSLTSTSSTSTSSTSTSSTSTASAPAADEAVAQTGNQSDTALAGADTGREATGQTGASVGEAGHTVVLPLIASTGPERRASSRAASSTTMQVSVEVEPKDAKRIDCRKGDAWITVVIYSGSGFDAATVDPGSVTLSSGVSDLGYGGNAYTVPVAFVARSRHAYQWQWRLDDMDGDGSADMVLEFRLDYTGLECNAAVVAVMGRTQDGQRFAGTHRVDMRIVERS